MQQLRKSFEFDNTKARLHEQDANRPFSLETEKLNSDNVYDPTNYAFRILNIEK